jgi:hypothetical protein
LAVEAFVGHRVSGWPFGRFDVITRELRVCLSFPWFAVRSQRATAIHEVVVATPTWRHVLATFLGDAPGSEQTSRREPAVRRYG